MFSVSLQSQSLRRVNQRNNIIAKPALTTNIPGVITEKSTYEVGQSSIRTKRSKRPASQSHTPVRFNLNVDGADVSKEYDKYIGISQGNSIISYLTH